MEITFARDGQGTIRNDDASISISDASQAESLSGYFYVTLSFAIALTVTVDYSTANGTATNGSDYTGISTTTLTFNPGETSKVVTVGVTNDSTYELNETFYVNLANATNANIADNQGVGTIQNDDAQPAAFIDLVSHYEGDSGTTTYTFNVTLSGTSSQTITLDWTTQDGTATTADNDYNAANGMLTFNPGETSKTISISVNGDTTFESDEYFDVILSNAINATILISDGHGTIRNDD